MYNLVNEGYTEWLDKFTKNMPDNHKDYMYKLFDRHKKLKRLKRLDKEDIDIDQLCSKGLRNFLITMYKYIDDDLLKTKANYKKDVFDENDEYYLYKIQSFKHLNKLAKGKGGWCIASDSGWYRTYIDDYNAKLYFACRKQPKGDNKDYIILMVKNGDMFLWDSKNNKIGRFDVNVPTNKINIFE